MMEKFYCVGCKKHHDLEVLEATEQNGKGGSIRYSLRSVCPSGHKTNKLCKREIYEAYGAEVSEPTASEVETYTYESLGKYNDDELREILTEMNEKSEKKLLSMDLKYGNTQLLKNLILGFQNLDSPYDSLLEPRGTSATPKFRYNAEGMTVGVNLEALAPTPDEPDTGEALVPADSLMPEGSGRTIGSQSVSHNYTPFHAEIAYAVSWEGKEDNNEGLIYGIEYTDEVGGVADVEWFSTAEERDEELARYLEKYGAESAEMIECGNCDATFSIDEGLDIGGIDYCEECYDTRMSKEVVEAETFIAYPELKDHLVAVMPDKIYGVKVMDDGDFEMKVANRYMDEVIATVSEYQMNEELSDSSGFLGSGFSKTTVAVATATLAVGLAYYFNRK